MRFLGYLNEDQQFDLDILEHNCSEMLKLVRKEHRFFYRGSKNNILEMGKLVPRSNRTPKDMDLEYHELIDKVLFRKFNWKPRSEGVFATSNLNEANVYGTEYIFLPTNNFHFIWSKNFIDLYTHIDNIVSDFYYNKIGILSNRNKSIKTHEQNLKSEYAYVFTYIKSREFSNNFIDTDLRDALVFNKNEVMFKCSTYYLVSRKFEYNILKG